MGKLVSVLSSVLVVVAFLNFIAVVAHNPLLDQCKELEKAIDDDMKTLRDASLPMTRPAKCVLACIGEKSERIVNNKLDPAGVVNYFKNSGNFTEQTLQQVKEIADSCSKIIEETDRCEYGAKSMRCFRDEAIKAGVKYPYKSPPPKN